MPAVHQRAHGGGTAARHQTGDVERLRLDRLFARCVRAGRGGGALAEVAPDTGEAHVLKDWERYSSVASTSAGIELMHNVVIVMGNSEASTSPYVIGHAVMRDAIDRAALEAAMAAAGLDPAAPGERLVNVFTKVEASPDGLVRGYRHIMLDDSGIGSTRHARAAVGGLIAGLAGTGAVYVSGGAEHQGPPGGGPLAAIARV
jgi:cyanuric acid amidohydrolase